MQPKSVSIRAKHVFKGRTREAFKPSELRCGKAFYLLFNEGMETTAKPGASMVNGKYLERSE
jgi:hypothetical protein